MLDPDPDPIKWIRIRNPAYKTAWPQEKKTMRRGCALVAAEEQHARGDSAANQRPVLPHFRHLSRALLLLSLQQAPVRFPLHHLRGCKDNVENFVHEKTVLKAEKDPLQYYLLYY